MQRATGLPGRSRFSAFHIFRTPYTPKFAAWVAMIRSSKAASASARAEGGRVLPA